MGMGMNAECRMQDAILSSPPLNTNNRISGRHDMWLSKFKAVLNLSNIFGVSEYILTLPFSLTKSASGFVLFRLIKVGSYKYL